MEDFYNKHKRCILLYKLGVPIPKKYSKVYDKFFEHFKYSKTIELLNQATKPCMCHVDSSDNILFCTWVENTENMRVYLNLNAASFKSLFYDKETMYYIEEKGEVAEAILKYLGIKFDDFYVNRLHDDISTSFFGHLKIEFSKYKNLCKPLNI